MDAQVDGGAVRSRTLLEIRGDSENAIGWLNGERICVSMEILSMLACSQQTLSELWTNGFSMPMQLGANWAYHVVRERNQAADKICNEVMDASRDVGRFYVCNDFFGETPKLRLEFDGGQRCEVAMAASAFVLSFWDDELERWVVIRERGWLVLEAASKPRINVLDMTALFVGLTETSKWISDFVLFQQNYLSDHDDLVYEISSSSEEDVVAVQEQALLSAPTMGGASQLIDHG